jgi:hypothetical protein
MPLETMLRVNFLRVAVGGNRGEAGRGGLNLFDGPA